MRSRPRWAGRSPKFSSRFGPPVAAASIAQVHRAEVGQGQRGARGRRRRCCALASSSAFTPTSRAFTFVARHAENLSAEARRLRLDRGGRHVAALRHDRDGFPPRGRGALGDGGEHQRRSRLSRADGRLGPHRKEVLTLEWIDATPLYDRARLEAKGFDLRQARPRADPDFPAPRAARRLLSRRHASGQSVRRRRGPADRRRFRHHGPARTEGAAFPRGNPATASSPATTSASPRFISRPAMCRRTIRWRFRPGDPRHRRADPQPHRRGNLHGAAVDACCSR